MQCCLVATLIDYDNRKKNPLSSVTLLTAHQLLIWSEVVTLPPLEDRIEDQMRWET